MCRRLKKYPYISISYTCGRRATTAGALFSPHYECFFAMYSSPNRRKTSIAAETIDIFVRPAWLIPSRCGRSLILTPGQKTRKQLSKRRRGARRRSASALDATNDGKGMQGKRSRFDVETKRIAQLIPTCQTVRTLSPFFLQRNAGLKTGLSRGGGSDAEEFPARACPMDCCSTTDGNRRRGPS
jgi:hypothetical protein